MPTIGDRSAKESANAERNLKSLTGCRSSGSTVIADSVMYVPPGMATSKRRCLSIHVEGEARGSAYPIGPADRHGWRGVASKLLNRLTRFDVRHRQAPVAVCCR